MFCIRIADLNIGINNRYDYVKDFCGKYIVPDTDYDLEVTVSRDELLAAREDGCSPGYIESLEIYRKIAEAMPMFSGFLMHGVLLDACSTGIAFLANSGVGKSTHAALWKKLCGAKIINGDKPIVRIIDNMLVGYGTPWAGKENEEINTSCKISKLCFINRSEENYCKKIKYDDAFMRFISHVYENEDMTSLLELIDRIPKETEFYDIYCNTNDDAAIVAHKVIFNNGR